MAATLPKNPSPVDYQKFYEALPEGQKEAFLKVGLKKMIESVYTSGIDDVREDPEIKGNNLSTGEFLDAGVVYRYEISNGGTIAYNPVAEGK